MRAPPNPNPLTLEPSPSNPNPDWIGLPETEETVHPWQQNWQENLMPPSPSQPLPVAIPTAAARGRPTSAIVRPMSGRGRDVEVGGSRPMSAMAGEDGLMLNKVVQQGKVRPGRA